MMNETPAVILYDGVCGLCNRFNVFVLKRDAQNKFQFASLQSSTARSILLKHGKDPSDLDTVYLVHPYGSPEEKLLARSAAVIAVLSRLGGVWRIIAGFLQVVPRPLRDAGYGLIARTRYKIFGKYEACRIPPKEWQSRFMDV